MTQNQSDPAGKSSNFKDHFSIRSTDYAQYRPGYPAVLFDYLRSLLNTTDCAWDCACGSGQATLPLSQRFRQVIASDASEQQIASAVKIPGVEFRVCPAEDSGLETSSVDLITVAQALHWFDFDAFYQEAGRVLKPTGMIAVWCYPLFRVNPEIDQIVDHLYNDVAGEFWPAERQHIESKYSNIPFPFSRLETPEFEIKTTWNCDQALGYFSTWSAVKRYITEHRKNPLELIETDLRAAWQEQQRTVTWPIHLQVGKLM